jgi:hypothetical protein
MTLTPLQRTALDRIEELARLHMERPGPLRYEDRADMGWIIKYVRMLRTSLLEVPEPPGL